YRKGFEADPKFLQIWEKIKHQTRYSVAYQTSDLTTLAAKAMKEMPETKKPSVRSTKNEVVMGTDGVTGKMLSDTVAPDYGNHFEIPDMLAYIQGKTELTRSTILDIVKKSDKIS